MTFEQILNRQNYLAKLNLAFLCIIVAAVCFLFSYISYAQASAQPMQELIGSIRPAAGFCFILLTLLSMLGIMNTRGKRRLLYIVGMIAGIGISIFLLLPTPAYSVHPLSYFSNPASTFAFCGMSMLIFAAIAVVRAVIVKKRS